MRSRWIVLFLAALLVMRGWVGESLAGQMLAQQLHPAQVVEAVHADCHGHEQAEAAAADDTRSGAHSTRSCDNCQDCSLNALPAAPVSLPVALPQAPRVERVSQFSSAEPRAGFKPPVA